MQTQKTRQDRHPSFGANPGQNIQQLSKQAVEILENMYFFKNVGTILPIQTFSCILTFSTQFPKIIFVFTFLILDWPLFINYQVLTILSFLFM